MTRLTLPLEAKSSGLRFYVVTFGPRAKPRLSYVVMAQSSSEVWDREAFLAEPGERMEVLPADSEPFPVMVARNEWEGVNLRDAAIEAQWIAADLAYLAGQKQRDAERVRIAHEQDLQHLRCIGGL
jgi:hypothetical protein